LPDGVYVAHNSACLKLDPVTGKTLKSYRLPPMPGEKAAPAWSFLSVAGDYLIGGSNPASLTRTPKKIRKVKGALQGPEWSLRLRVWDRGTGKFLWRVGARDGFRQNAICAGNGRLFAIDREVVFGSSSAAKKKQAKAPAARLLALDLATGRERWKTEGDV